jgi:hypothetical protein
VICFGSGMVRPAFFLQSTLKFLQIWSTLSDTWLSSSVDQGGASLLQQSSGRAAGVQI